MTTTLIILAATIMLFISGRIRADIVALAALTLMILLGILTPDEALAGFSNPVIIMMVGLFVVGGAVLQTGLAKLVSQRILPVAHGSDTLMFLLVVLVTSFIGAFVSNTGTVALMMPIIVSMAAQSGKNPSQFLMPLAFATMIEHIGDICAISSTVGENFIEEPGLHRSLLGDGLATALAALFGAPANTTYGENTGVLALTKVYDSKVVRLAALFACGVSFLPLVSAVIETIPTAVIGGISFVGGIGKIRGVIMGVVLLRIIFVGLTFLGIDSNMQYVIKGLIILVACAIDIRKYLVRK